jgi:hypothetical protein
MLELEDGDPEATCLIQPFFARGGIGCVGVSSSVGAKVR